MKAMRVNMYCMEISKCRWLLAENGDKDSASRSDAVHLKNCIIGYCRAVPFILPHLAAVYRNEYAGYVIADLLQNAPDREIFVPRDFFPFGLYQCGPPQSHYNRIMKRFSQVYINEPY